jgi:hypothetical protein
MKTLVALLLMTTAVSAQQRLEGTRMTPDNMTVLGLERPLVTDEELAKIQPPEKQKEDAYKTGTMLVGTPTVPKFPTEEQKAKALRDAYGKQTPAEIAHSLNFGLNPPVVVVKTERIIPVAAPEEKNFIDATADTNWDARRKFMNRTFRATRQMLADADVRDVCQQHDMHKVITHGGKSWRCR